MTLRTPAFNDAKSYGFEWLRAGVELDNQEGVVSAGDLKTTAAAAGGQRVDIAAGMALIKGDSGVPGTGLTQGLFIVVNDAAVVNAVTLNASDGALPRLDQIVMRVRDSSDLGSGADDAVFEVVTGAATAGATLDNRNGAGALPADRLRLADVLVPAASSAVTAGNVRDRRPWARGAYRRILLTNGNKTFTLSTHSDIDSTNLTPRIELSGAPLDIRFRGRAQHSVANAYAGAALMLDGGTVDGFGGGTALNDWVDGGRAASGDIPIGFDWTTLPSAPNNGAGQASNASGSHVIKPQMATGAATLTVFCGASTPLLFVLREDVRQNADNT